MELLSNILNWVIIVVSVLVVLSILRLFFRINSKEESIIKSTFKSSLIFILVGYLLWSLAEIIWGFVEYVGENPAFGVVEYFYILGYFFVFGGFMYLFYFICSNKDKMRTCFLKGLFLIIILGFATFYLNNFFNSSLLADLSGFNLFTSHFYPVASMVVLIVSFSLYRLFREEKVISVFFILLFLSALFMYLGDVLYSYYILRDVYGSIGVLSDCSYIIEYLLAGYSFYYLADKMKGGKK